MSKTTQLSQKVLETPLEVTTHKTLRLGDLQEQYIVLYFYPKDDTPGCTIEGKGFTALYQAFQQAGAAILGISRDSLASHEKFKKKYKYTIDLISDPKEYLCQFFNVIKEKNLFGKKVRGIERSTFVLNQERKIIQEWRKVKVLGHAKEVLQFIKS